MDERDERMRGTSLVAAITVSGRHAFLVGYQPDEALRPSLASSLSLSLPLPPVHSPFPLLLSPSFFLSFSLILFRNLLPVPCRCKSSRRGNGSLSTELYIYTRAPLSPELTGSWKNLGRTLLTSTNYSFYVLLTLSTRIKI